MRKTTKAARRRLANELWAKVVKARPGGCELPRAEHKGDHFQAAHGFGKKAYPAVRYLPLNGFKACPACHVFYTHRAIEWDQFLRDVWGEPVYQELRRLALENAPVDIEATIERLRAELTNLPSVGMTGTEE